MYPASMFPAAMFPTPMYPGAGKGGVVVVTEPPGSRHPDPAETTWTLLIVDPAETAWTPL